MKLLYVLVLFILSSIKSFSIEKQSNNHNMNSPKVQSQTSNNLNQNIQLQKGANSLKSSNINLKSPQKKPLESLIEKKIDLPSTTINSLNTQIFISKNKCSANIHETAVFTLSNGIFHTITRRISLDGSADSISGFKMASS